MSDRMRWATRFVDRVRRRGRPAAVRALRLTAAATVAYVVALVVVSDPQPLTAPLTALLVVQVSLFATLTTGLRRVAAVVSGVLVAVLLASVVGLTWWSLAAVITAALVVGQLLRLGEHLLEVPISAMLVLGVGSLAETAAFTRVAETLVGAGVGVLFNVVLPPSLRSGSAGEAVERVAVEAAAVLDSVADELPEEASVAQAERWLEEWRRIVRYVARADSALVEAEQSRRLNPRAVGRPGPEPALRSGLDALEHSVVALRALFRSILDGLREASRSEDEAPAYDEELRNAFAVLVRDVADAVRAFGALLRAEAEGGETEARHALEQELEALGETRALLTELLLVDARESPGLWEVRGSLLAAVARVLSELDVEERVRQRDRLRAEAVQRARAGRTVRRLARRP